MKFGEFYIGCGFGATSWEWQVGKTWGGICYLTGGDWGHPVKAPLIFIGNFTNRFYIRKEVS